MLKKHKACCKKYKPYILKYKALISKYMPYIFRCYKRLVYKGALYTIFCENFFRRSMEFFLVNKYNNGHIIIHKSPIVLKNNRAFFCFYNLSLCACKYLDMHINTILTIRLTLLSKTCRLVYACLLRFSVGHRQLHRF